MFAKAPLPAPMQGAGLARDPGDTWAPYFCRMGYKLVLRSGLPLRPDLRLPGSGLAFSMLHSKHNPDSRS